MKGKQSNRALEKRSLLTFFALVFLLSIPIWVLDPVVGHLLPEELIANLPVSSLMFIVPGSVAVILVQREGGSSAGRKLLKQAFDYGRIKRKLWYVPILLLWPVMMILQYVLVKFTTLPLADPQLPGLMLPVSFAVFFIAAVGEEVGWHYNPAVGLGITAAAAAIITFLWGPETLARFRYARQGEDVRATLAG